MFARSLFSSFWATVQTFPFAVQFTSLGYKPRSRAGREETKQNVSSVFNFVLQRWTDEVWIGCFLLLDVLSLLNASPSSHNIYKSCLFPYVAAHVVELQPPVDQWNTVKPTGTRQSEQVLVHETIKATRGQTLNRESLSKSAFYVLYVEKVKKLVTTFLRGRFCAVT